MGFTRYWVRPAKLDAEKFSLFSKACQEVCQEYSGCIANAIFSDDVVMFDGSPNWEPFMIERVSSYVARENRHHEKGIFEFCKTAKLPYDEAVAKCIDLLKEHFPEVEVEEPS